MPRYSKLFARKAGKFGNTPTGSHASKKEHNRAAQLHMWQQAGLIANLREQVPFTLLPPQYINDGVDPRGRPIVRCVERSCRYIADFVYTDTATGLTIVEDTKGFRTKDYIIKRKLMLYIHGIRIKEV